MAATQQWVVSHLVIGESDAFASIGAGGVAATPAKALLTEQSLMGQPFNQGTFKTAESVLSNEFKPLSDMRASSVYRTHILKSLLIRFAFETLNLDEPGPSPKSDRNLFWVDLSNAKASALSLEHTPR